MSAPGRGLPRLAITVGDPRGIGAEIIAAALADDAIRGVCDPLVVGPLGVAVKVDDAIGKWNPNTCTVADAGRLSGVAIGRAVALVREGVADGIVTGPIDKRALLDGGYAFPGHTEMLAALFGVDTTMMLASDRLRVILATTHLSLRSAADAVTADAIIRAAHGARVGLRDWFGIAEPRIALCALNPHGGDGGRFGDEDDRVLAPAARQAGLSGPFPADTVFVRAIRGEFDAVIAPYHDVGMTAIKVASFGSAVNITLGLPAPRTSPDHGTAMDIAGKGIADASSMKQAIRVCAEIVTRVRGQPPAA